MGLRHLHPSRSSAGLTTCFFSLFVSLCILLSYSALHGPVLLAAAVLVVAALVVVAARASVVAWITVVVLLAFSGKRHRVLVNQARKITTDLAAHLIGEMLGGGGLVAFACASVLSLIMATSCLISA
ncbi:hypothetical protein NMG60_11004511 [Bertholletia excelsa]